MSDNKIDYNKLDSILAGTNPEQPVQPSPLSDEEKALLDQEVELEKKYGDKPVQAALTGAASGLTLGLSDQALTQSGLYSKEELREIRERSPVAETVGEITGFGAGLFASGGAAGLGAGAKATVAAGRLAEKTAAKVLQKAIIDTGRKKLAKEVLKKGIEKGLAGAAEGATLGLGQAISEDALGKADFNAENIVANMGSGALVGGTLGGVLGSLSATVPTVKQGLAPVKERIQKKVASFMDRGDSAVGLSRMSTADEARALRQNKNFKNELADYMQEDLKPKFFGGPEDLNKANVANLEKVGSKIDEIVAKYDTLTSEGALYPRSRREVASNLRNILNEEESFLQAAPGSNTSELKVLNRFRKDLNKLGTEEGRFTFKELNDLRKNYQKKAYRAGVKGNTFTADIADKLRAGIRTEQEAMADFLSNSSTNPEIRSLADELKTQNKKYWLGSLIKKPLGKAAVAEGRASSLKFRDLLETLLLHDVGGPAGIAASAVTKFLRSDMSKSMALLADVQKANQSVQKRLDTSVKNFFAGKKRIIRPVSTQVLLQSGFSSEPETRKRPETKLQAYKNVEKNIDNLKADPQALIDRLAKTTMRVSAAAPQTAQEMQFVLQRSLQFLDSKIPRDPANSAASELFKRDYIPSSMELAKFERYLQAVEAPMTVLEDLENGTATREQIEAIKMVYPNLYSRIQTTVINQLTDKTQKISYNKRLQLGILLDIPTDEALLPENIQALQSNFAPPPEQQDSTQSAVNPTVSGTSNIEFSNRAMTETQQVQTRE